MNDLYQGQQSGEAHAADSSAAEAIKRRNWNAPLKQMFVDLRGTTELVVIKDPSAGGHVLVGNRLVAAGRCPGRDCKGELLNADADGIMRIMGKREAHKIRCMYCGQIIEAMRRLVSIVR